MSGGSSSRDCSAEVVSDRHQKSGMRCRLDGAAYLDAATRAHAVALRLGDLREAAVDLSRQAEALSFLGRDHDAVAVAERALAALPDDAGPFYEANLRLILASMMMRAERAAEALPLIADAEDLLGEVAREPAAVARGLVHLVVGRLDEAGRVLAGCTGAGDHAAVAAGLAAVVASRRGEPVGDRLERLAAQPLPARLTPWITALVEGKTCAGPIVARLLRDGPLPMPSTTPGVFTPEDVYGVARVLARLGPG